MFWKFIRWGGTIAIILLVMAAAYLSSHGEAQDPAQAVPATPADAPPPAKNFNL